MLVISVQPNYINQWPRKRSNASPLLGVTNQLKENVVTSHEKALMLAAQEAKAAEARAYEQMERRTNQMLDARRAAAHTRACMERMLVVVAMQRDTQLFAKVVGCLSQEDLEQMAFDDEPQRLISGAPQASHSETTC